jgi:Dolichyl-phosphate-mannose-protein mannosyltransferase
MNDSTTARLRARWLIPLGLFIGATLLVALTSKDYGITWDEPPYFHASDLHIGWMSIFVANSVRGELRESLADQTIQSAWRWNPYNVPHPPFSRIVSGLSQLASTPVLDKISGYRLGPALFFAFLVTLVFRWMDELFGRAAGLFSACAVVVTPNLFGYAHFAVTDMPLAAMWFATVYCFYKGLSSWRWSFALGIVWGLAVSTKFPALLALIPLVVWAHWFYRDKYANNVFAMLFLAPIVMVATQPYLWHQTGLRVLEFLYEGISRGYRVETNFGVFFSHQVLYSHQLPWYYPFFLVGVTTPEPIMILALLGTISLIGKREHRSVITLLLLNGTFILILGAMPGAVLHDGVRQMLSALPFIATLAGAGFYVVAASLHCFAQNKPRLWTIENIKAKIYVALFLVLGFAPVLDLYLSHPYQLSFYNRLVGGIRGAYQRGLETTYFLEALTPDFLRAMNEKLPRNASVNASFANIMLAYYQKQGLLRQDLTIINHGSFDYLLLLNRRSALSARERNLIDSAKRPYLSVSLAGVPLVSAFEFKKSSEK